MRCFVGKQKTFVRVSKPTGLFNPSAACGGSSPVRGALGKEGKLLGFAKASPDRRGGTAKAVTERF